MKINASDLIGPVVGAAGAAIGIGILAKTAQNVTDTMGKNTKRKSKPIKYQRKQQRNVKFKINNYWGGI